MNKFYFGIAASLVFSAMHAQTTATFSYTGAMQTFVVPTCVSTISVDVMGAQGGGGVGTTAGGMGGRVQADIPVTPGQTLYIFVGGQGDISGPPGYNGGGTGVGGSPAVPGGGGGGASDIRIGGTTLNDRAIVAGGGGGGVDNGGPATGGAGGGLVGGGPSPAANPWACTPLMEPTGGTQSAGGLGGTSSSCAWNGNNGQFGIGGDAYFQYRSAGGGGGWYGGGGGHNGCGGAGGSSYTYGSATNVTHTQGFQTGNGQVVLTYNAGPQTPGAITGNATICEGSTASYSISPVAGATSYTWSVPAGTNITSGQGTTSITITAGNTSGSIGVYASGPCGTSGTQTFALGIDPLSSVGTVDLFSSPVCEGTQVNLSTSGESAGTLMWYEYDGMNYNYLGNGNPYMTAALTAGNHQFVAMIASGVCATDTSGFVPVTADTMPVAGTIISPPQNGHVCAFDSVTFSVGGSFGSIDWFILDTTSGTWNSFGSGNPFDPGAPSNSDTGAYVFIAVASHGACPSDTSAQLMVSVNETPVVNLGPDISQCGGTATLDAGYPGNMYLWNNGATTQVVTNANTGVYIVTVTTPFGCSGGDTVLVTIHQPPVVDLGADTTLCDSTLVLDATTSGATYLWNTNAVTPMITVNNSGTYSVLVTDLNGCTDTDSIDVTLHTPPVVVGSASSNFVCVDDAQVTLFGSPAGGTWSGTGVVGSNFNPLTAGPGTWTLTYNYTDANGCSGVGTTTIVVNPCTGIQENSLSSAVNVYPNPNSGTFTIAVNADAADLKIEITGLDGRVVYRSEEKQVAAGFSKQIDLEGLSGGIYLLRVSSETGTFVEKITLAK